MTNRDEILRMVIEAGVVVAASITTIAVLLLPILSSL